jgi:hypothetical protein
MSTRNPSLLVLLALVSCAPAQAPETAASESSSAAPPADSAPAAPEPDESSEALAPATATEAAPAEAAANQPSVVDVCLKRCERLATTCSKTALDSCRADCGQWKTLPAGCESQIRVAVECMSEAPDAQCANIAPPSCAKQFRAFTRCKDGNPEPVAESAKSANDTAGLQPVQDAAGGFKVLLPEKPKATQQDGHPAWTVQKDGVSYEIHRLPPLTGKLNPKTFLKAMTGFLGPCAAKMRLHGMIDTPNYTLMRFETRCKDGVEWRGAIHSAKNATYVIGLKGPTVELARAEAFLGSFQTL